MFAIDLHTLGYVTILSDKTTLKMTTELIIQFSDHARHKDIWANNVRDLLPDFVMGRDKEPVCVDGTILTARDAVVCGVNFKSAIFSVVGMFSSNAAAVVNAEVVAASGALAVYCKQHKIFESYAMQHCTIYTKFYNVTACMLPLDWQLNISCSLVYLKEKS